MGSGHHSHDLNAPAAHDPFIGRVLADKFKLLARVGTGASGTVYEAEQLSLGRTVAVKVLRPKLSRDERFVARFHDEALASSRLNHPNTVSIIDYGCSQEVLFLVMEFLRGPTLTQLLAKRFPLSNGETVDIAMQILAGLEEAHHAGVVHADLKLDNIVVEQRRNGTVAKVVDFGIARIVGSARDTEAGLVCGTPEYMAPEVISGQPPTFASDIYAMGVVLYELLTKTTPFAAESDSEILRSHLDRQPVTPTNQRPDLTILPALSAAAMTALAKEPGERFGSVAEFRAALAQTTRARTTTKSCEEALCPGCGIASPENFKFCPECGHTKTETLQSSTTEAQTQTKVQASERFPLPLVGRDRELAIISDFLDANSPTRLLQIVGATGAGRTRLVETACKRLLCDSPNTAIYLASPDPTGLRSAYYPIRAVVAAALELPPRCEATQLQLAVERLQLPTRDVPGIAELFGHTSELSELDPPARLRELVASTSRALQAIAGAGSTVFVFDDVDDYDGPSQDLLRRLAEYQAPLKLIVINRPEFARRWPPTADRVDIESLNRQSVAQLSEHLEGFLGPAAPSTDTLWLYTEGLPGTITHLARFISEGGTFTQKPRTPADVVAARLAMLPQPSVILSQAAAALGLEVERNVLAATTRDQLSTGRFELALSVLRTRGILTDAGSHIRFSSAICRDVTYAGTPADIRKQLHGQIASILRTQLPNPAGLGHHTERAELLDEGSQLLLQAGDEAVRRFDNRGATRLFERALAATRKLMLERGDETVRAQFVEISAKLGDSLRVGGHVALARGILEEALTCSDGIAQHRAALLRSLAHLALINDKMTEASSFLAEAIGLAIAVGNTELLCNLYLELSNTHLRTSQPRPALRELEEALNLVTLGEGEATTHGPKNLWRILHRIAVLRGSTHHYTSAIDCATHALRHARRVGSRIGMATCQETIARYNDELGNAFAAQRARTAAVEEMRSLGDRRTTAELLLTLISPATDDNESLQEAVALAHEVGWSEGVERAKRAMTAAS